VIAVKPMLQVVTREVATQNTRRFVHLTLGAPSRAHALGGASRATKKLLMQLGVLRVVRFCRLCNWYKKPNHLHQLVVQEQFARLVFRLPQ
jgi:hypothetical protein